MKDVRDNDFIRKMSQIRGRSIHTLEFRLFKNEIELEEINIRCVVKIFDDRISEEKTRELSNRLRKTIPVRTLYELYSVLDILTEGKKDEVHIIGLENDKAASELLYCTDFMRQMKEIDSIGDMCHILMTHAEENTIEGLQREIDEVTIVISFRLNHEIIVISD